MTRPLKASKVERETTPLDKAATDQSVRIACELILIGALVLAKENLGFLRSVTLEVSKVGARREHRLRPIAPKLLEIRRKQIKSLLKGFSVRCAGILIEI